MNTLKQLLLSLSIASLGIVSNVRADDTEDTTEVMVATEDQAQETEQNLDSQAEAFIDTQIKPFLDQYGTLIKRISAKSALEVGANVVKDTPEVLAGRRNRLFPKLENGTTGKIASIVGNTLIEEAMPQDPNATQLNTALETLVPVTVAQVATSKGREVSGRNAAAFLVTLAQKSASKNFFWIEADTTTKEYALKAADFLLSCIDTKALTEKDAAGTYSNGYTDAFSLRTGLAKLIAKQISDRLVKPAVEARVNNKNFQKATVDILKLLAIDDVCKVACKGAFKN